VYTVQHRETSDLRSADGAINGTEFVFDGDDDELARAAQAFRVV
jgi:hypothetical protein